MNQIDTAARVRVISCLVEGNSLRATARITGIHRTTIMKLSADLAEVATIFQDAIFRNLACERLECDEIWNFVGCKERHVPVGQKGKGRGDVWTWIAIDPDTKLVPHWHVGSRELKDAYAFIHGLKARLSIFGSSTPFPTKLSYTPYP